jgi:hypothetical protein
MTSEARCDLLPARHPIEARGQKIPPLLPRQHDRAQGPPLMTIVCPVIHDDAPDAR